MMFLVLIFLILVGLVCGLFNHFFFILALMALVFLFFVPRGRT